MQITGKFFAFWSSKYKSVFFFFYGSKIPSWPMLPYYRASQSNSVRHTTHSRTSLDEWSARRTDLYLTTHNTHNRQISLPTGGIRTHSLKKRMAADSRLTLRGHWVRLNFVVIYLNVYCFSLSQHGSVSITENSRLMLLRKIITFYYIIRNT